MTALLLAAITGCDSAGPMEVDPPPVLRGRVVMLGGGDPSALRARTTWQETQGEANVSANGGFEIELEARPSGEGTVVVETLSGAGTHHPAWIPLQGFAPDQELVVVLAPRSWQVRAGAHEGTDVAVSPAAAADPTVLPSFWGFTFGFTQDGIEQTVLDETRWTVALRTWPSDQFPVPVALDHTDTAQPFAATDSALLWGHIEALEDVLGRDLFRPAARESLQVEEALQSEAVLVRLDADLDLRGRAFVGLEQDWITFEDVTPWSSNAVASFDGISGDLTGAVVRLRDSDAVEDRALVIHEMMHTLGAGHGCRWTSVQTYCPDLSAPLPTAEDVAYLEVLEAMRAAEKEQGTRHGVVAAVLGERVVTLGLGPYPSADLVGQPEPAPPRSRSAR